MNENTHTFDKRMEDAVRALRNGTSKQPVTCLHCKKLITAKTLDQVCLANVN